MDAAILELLYYGYEELGTDEQPVDDLFKAVVNYVIRCKELGDDQS